MEYDMHSNPQAYRTAIEKEGYHLSDLVIERVINLQMKYRWQNRPFDFSDFLLDDEAEVLRQIDEAENNLSTLMSERLCGSLV